MKYSNTQILTRVLGVTAMTVSLAAAQVRQIGGGQALDASLQVGSGGINYAVPQNYTPNTGMSSLTQSRGLSAFKGHAPTISNQMSIGISTDGVDRFQQQSVGVQQAVQGGPGLYDPQSTMYNSQLRTFLRPSDIVQANYGRRVPLPGDQPVSKNTKLAEDLFVDATAGFKPIMPTDVNEMAVGNALGLPRMEGGAPDGAHQWAKTLDSQQLAQRGGRDLFGMVRQEDRAKLAQEISDFDQSEETPGTPGLTVKSEEPIQPVDPRLKSTDLTRKLEGPTAPKTTSTPLRPTQTAEGEGAQPGQPPDRQQIDPNTGLPRENADAYFDMLVKMRSRRLAQQERAPGQPEGFQPPGPAPVEGAPRPPAPGATTPEEQTTTPRQALQPMDQAVLDRMKAAVPHDGRTQSVELTSGNQIVVHRIAGEADDTFNRYMRRAESAMKARRYYQAARQYSLAAAARPTNPMAHMGACLANFAANEWLTSARNLRTAMELFPPLMEAKMDLKQLVPLDNWPAQLDLMEQWVDKTPDQPLLVFLAAFIEHNYGRDDPAAQRAAQIRTFTNPPKILLAYAEFITTGKLPTDMKPLRRAAPTEERTDSTPE
ncbi:MAG: hypothetical protein JXA11_05285 [Phycisphaerae bacterium]|nr:hypothetical protein [Phycisphaerae bacterium]